MADTDPRDSGSSVPLWFDRHLWQIQPIRDVLLFLGVLFLFLLGKTLSVVTVPLMLALLLAYLFAPLMNRLEKISWMSRQGAAATLIACVVVVVVIPVSIGASFGVVNAVGFVRDTAQGANALVEFNKSFDRSIAQDEDFEQRLSFQAPAVQARYESLPSRRWKSIAQFYITRLDPEAGEVEVIENWVVANADQIAKTTIGTGAGALRAVISAVTGVAAFGFGLFLTAFFFFFIASGYPAVKDWGESLIPVNHKDRTLDLLGKMDAVVSGFVRGRLTIMLIQIVIFAIAYWLIGIPTPLMLGVLVGVLSIVPYLALIGIPISIVLLWIDGPQAGFRSHILWTIGAPLAVYFGGQAADDYVLTPRIQGKSTGMDTPTILFASLAGGVLFGVYGLLIAIPVAACLKILMTEMFWPRFREWAEGRRSDPLPLSEAGES